MNIIRSYGATIAIFEYLGNDDFFVLQLQHLNNWCYKTAIARCQVRWALHRQRYHYYSVQCNGKLR